MRTRELHIFALVVVILFLGNPALASEKNIVPSTQIEVTGEAIKHSFILKPGDLGAMTGAISKDTIMAGAHQGFIGIHDYRGVLLRDIIEKAKLTKKPKGIVIIVSAADGFHTAISWGELFNSLAGEHMIIAYERDGKPLGNDESFARLIIPTDKYIADRAVKRVNKIEIKYGNK